MIFYRSDLGLLNVIGMCANIHLDHKFHIGTWAQCGKLIIDVKQVGLKFMLAICLDGTTCPMTFIRMRGSLKY